MIRWADPWYSVEDEPELQAGLDAQLQRELAPGHVLEGRRAHAIGRRDDCDDVLYELDGGAAFAYVHLTWRRSREEDSRWPAAALFGSTAEVTDLCIAPAAKEWAEADEDHPA